MTLEQLEHLKRLTGAEAIDHGWAKFVTMADLPDIDPDLGQRLRQVSYDAFRGGWLGALVAVSEALDDG